MTSHEQLLRRIASEIEVLDELKFRHRTLGTLTPPRDVQTDLDRPLLVLLCRTIYLAYHVGDLAAAQLFLNGGKPTGALYDIEDYDYTERLHTANRGKGFWDGGWAVVDIIGSNRVVSKKSISLIAAPDELRPPSPAAGTQVSVLFPPEARYQVTGWYSVRGDCGRPLGDDLVRIYFTLDHPDAAPSLLSALASELNRTDTPFGLKTVNDPAGLLRRDSFVVYLDRESWLIHQHLFARLGEEHGELLRDDPPRFALRIAHGISFAHEPRRYAPAMSFGEHRSMLVADGLLDAWEAGSSTSRAKVASIEARFTAAGLDARRPYLNPEQLSA
ncbi:T3SS effector HopA1 family protein [Amycolatopsis sp. NPDC059090]|uniref:T3SS effector HopA1 family protein n=1 Tax=unclassified Amycolatopsis TaxID=2618356 RepID=UPI0036702C8D